MCLLRTHELLVRISVATNVENPPMDEQPVQIAGAGL